MRRVMPMLGALLAIVVPGFLSGSAAATTGGKPQMLLVGAPNPVIESANASGAGNVVTVLEISSTSKHADQSVTVFTTGLSNRCSGGVTFQTLEGGSSNAPRNASGSIHVVLDAKANADLLVFGQSCKTGSAIVKTELDSAPFSTASTKLQVEAPTSEIAGIAATPQTETETGDGGIGEGIYGLDDVYAIFTISAGPTHNGQVATITSNDLTQNCSRGYRWETGSGTSLKSSDNTGKNVIATSSTDADGNVTFVFLGSNCVPVAAGVTAGVDNPGGLNYAVTFTSTTPSSSL